ncbi:preprotein translocase subunit SecG [Pusillimonas sp. MFBS29]|uniref:preprotein translocase subunit SecG n=1 Tax=Pusillimonas sp. MFBS29 TaxID=2886690 RepID=UPI001D12ED16|nr:preprotein translocase subunit SecG [Pusillimonas sp. MFBS29]MCC2595060.1 preprotein translocase subunit SecG [Pusillimonas sp. MFBS29]
MQWLSPVLMAIQVISSLSVIVLVLLQQGKGADMGASFGGGSAGSLFGATGAANFLSRTTKWAAIIFFASTLGLAWVAHHPAGGSSIIDGGVMQGFQGQEVPSGTGSAVPSAPGAASSGAAVPAAPAPVPAAPESSAVPQAPAASAVPSAPAESEAPAAAPAQEGEPAANN